MLPCYYRSKNHCYKIFTASKITPPVREELFHGCLRKKKILPVKLRRPLLNDNPAWCINWSRHPLNVVQQLPSIPRALAMSCVFKCIAWHVVGNHFAHRSVTTYDTATATCGSVPLLCTIKHSQSCARKYMVPFILPKLLHQYQIYAPLFCIFAFLQ